MSYCVWLGTIARVSLKNNTEVQIVNFAFIRMQSSFEELPSYYDNGCLGIKIKMHTQHTHFKFHSIMYTAGRLHTAE